MKNDIFHAFVDSNCCQQKLKCLVGVAEPKGLHTDKVETRLVYDRHCTQVEFFIWEVIMVDIISLLSTDGYIMCNKTLIRLYGSDCAILIGELCAEYNNYKITGELIDDSFYSTQENIENNTGINAYYQRKAFKVLQDEGIITHIISLQNKAF